MQAQFFLADNGVNTVVSTSAGRLFDGLSAALGLCRQSTFEGQGAMALQFAAEAWEQTHGEEAVVPGLLERLSDRYALATQRVFDECVQSYVKHGDAGREAYAFHKALAAWCWQRPGRLGKRRDGTPQLERRRLSEYAAPAPVLPGLGTRWIYGTASSPRAAERRRPGLGQALYGMYHLQ